ncbi:MAG: glycosyltransferase family 39 protein [Chloroflexi bacterium]|nr:glycosyltransferase family 39 protein [Chloroflexota bacterium]
MPPRTAPPTGTRSWTAIAAVLLVLAIGLAAKAPELVLPIGPDQGTYSYVAERILEGGQPYVDAFDNKPPLTYFAHAAVLALVPADVRWSQSCTPGDLFQPCGYVALQLTDLLWTAATLGVLYAIARRVTGSAGGALTATLLAAVFLNLSQLSKEGSTPEKQLLLPMALSYWAVLCRLDGGRRAWLVLAGVCAGLGFLFKQTAISIPVALLGWALWQHFPLRATASGAVRFGLGWLVPIVLVSAYLGLRGALPAFWDASFAYNLGQTGSDLTGVPYAFLRGAWQVFNESSALLWLLAFGGALCVLGTPSTASQRLALCWAGADLASLFLGGTKFAQVYFVQLVPAFALLAALALGAFWTTTRQQWLVRLFGAVALATVFALSTSFQVHVALRALHERLPGRALPAAEQLVAAQVPRGDGLFVWGDASQTYLFADGQSPSPYFQAYPLTQVFNRGSGYLARRSMLMRALQAHPPAAIAIDPATSRDDPDGQLGLNLNTFPELQQLIGSRYRPVDAGRLPAGWLAYVRID